MDLLAIGIIAISLIMLANILVVRNRTREQKAFSWLLLLINLPLFLVSLLLLLGSEARINEFQTEIGTNLNNIRLFGLILFLMAIWSLVAVIQPVRQVLAKIMPLDPASPVHTLALVFSGYLVGQSALTLSQGGLDGLAQNVAPTSVAFFVLSELLFVVIAIFGVGLLIRRNGHEVNQRLGLTRPKPIHLVWGIGLILILVFLQAMAGAIWALLFQDQAELLNDVNALLLTNIDTVWEWLILAIAAGVGEELLFRGALQPVFGLGFTAVLFGIVHVQYGFTPILLFVIFLAIVLGLVRRYFSNTMAIFIHAGYNFVLGLLALLAVYLEQFLT
jgi:membrane protease YdiL (CAAX protease family)